MNESIAEFVGALLEWGLGVIGVGGGGLVVGGGDIVTGTSLAVSKKAPATHEDFDFSQKTPDFQNSS